MYVRNIRALLTEGEKYPEGQKKGTDETGINMGHRVWKWE